MNLEFVKDLWLPNIFIYNLKTFKVLRLNEIIGFFLVRKMEELTFRRLQSHNHRVYRIEATLQSEMVDSK